MSKAPAVLPTKRQVISQLGLTIDSYRALMKSAKHPGTHNSILHSIRCLELALQIVKGTKQVKKLRRVV